MAIDKRKLFTVRALDLSDANDFDSVGRITGLDELVTVEGVSGEDALAIIERYEDDNVGNIEYLETLGGGDVVGLRVKIDFGFISQYDAKTARDEAVKSILQWAEKSRVTGERGFRNSAVMNGRLEQNSQFDYVYTTKVLLGTTAYYGNDNAITGLEFDDARIAKEQDSLQRGLREALGRWTDFDLTVTRL